MADEDSGPEFHAEQSVVLVRVGMSLSEAEKLLIEATLRHTHWHIKRAAQILGIDRSTVYAKIKAHGILKEQPP